MVEGDRPELTELHLGLELLPFRPQHGAKQPSYVTVNTKIFVGQILIFLLRVFKLFTTNFTTQNVETRKIDREKQRRNPKLSDCDVTCQTRTEMSNIFLIYYGLGVQEL